MYSLENESSFSVFLWLVSCPIPVTTKPLSLPMSRGSLPERLRWAPGSASGFSAVFAVCGQEPFVDYFSSPAGHPHSPRF